MATFHELSTSQLRQALQLREQIETLESKLNALLGGGNGSAGTSAKVGRPAGRSKGKRTMSPEARERIRAAQQARWAKVKGKSAPAKATTAKAAPTKAQPKARRGGLTAEGRAKLAAAMKARWAARKKGGAAPNAPAS